MGFFNFSGKSDRTENEQAATEPISLVEQSNSSDAPARREDNSADEVFSVPVKAGKRIYYFDVKATRSDDYYVTITESRKRPMRDGSFTIDKHKIHLYKEDFTKFAEGFESVIAYVKEHKPDFFEAEARGEFLDTRDMPESEAPVQPSNDEQA
ncbi:MAG: DUF3276 family protein [Mucinivorans sp.]